MIAFQCASCGKSLKVQDELAGKKGKCPQCRQPVRIPLAETVAAPPAAEETKLVEPAAAVTAPPPIDQAPSRPVVPGYEILDELGRGGMGVVYKARQAALGRLVALKMILAGAHAGPVEMARFKIEAEALARLQHGNIVQIHEVGEHEGRPFFSLEFVDGGSLADQLDGTPRPARLAAALVEKLARAMHAAHQRGIVHRDLKPGNVLMMTDGTPKITDFGLAKHLDEDSGQTRTGAIMGTPAYMAPEQAAGRTKDITPTTDVYALGVILYELLTGRVPFSGPPQIVILNVINQEPTTPRSVNKSVPRDLETICLKCLQKDPGKRYPDAAELTADLRHFQKHEPIEARRTPLWERGLMWVRRRPAVAGLLALSLLAVLAVAVGSIWYNDQMQRMWRQVGLAHETTQQLREEIVLAKAEAESRRGEAQKARAEAAVQCAEANKARVRAEEDANKARAEAEEQREEALKAQAQREEANKARTEAEEARRTAMIAAESAGGSNRIKALGGRVTAAEHIIRGVDFSMSDRPDAALKELKENKSLQVLRLSGTKVTDAGLKEVKDLKSLQILYLDKTQVTDAGLKELDGLHDLHTLSLAETKVTGAGLKKLKSLRTLNLEGSAVYTRGPASASPVAFRVTSGLTDAGMKGLHDLQSLQAVSLRATQITDIGLKELKELRNLQMLNLSYTTNVTGEGLHGLKSLQTLDLTNSWVTDAGLKGIELPSLHTLNLTTTKATGAGLQQLKSLRTLTLCRNLTDPGVKALKELKNLETLNLTWNDNITNAAVKDLKELKNLKTLSLSSSKITDAAVDDLKELTNLQTLNLYGTQVTIVGEQALIKALPKCKIGRNRKY